MALEDVVRELDAEIARLQEARKLLAGDRVGNGFVATTPRKGRQTAKEEACPD